MIVVPKSQTQIFSYYTLAGDLNPLEAGFVYLKLYLNRSQRGHGKLIPNVFISDLRYLASRFVLFVAHAFTSHALSVIN